MQKETVHRYVTIAQIDELRDAAHALDRNESLRDEVLVVLMADLGLRVSELVQLKRSMVNLEDGEVQIPGSIQKEYPNERSPRSARIRIDPYGHFSTVRLLRTYFNSKWYQSRRTDYIFPSRQSQKMTTRSVRNVVKRLAIEADVRPRRTDGEPAQSDELHPHALRHSVSNYMLREDDVTPYDVKQRLRHQSILTTERIYEHFERR